jgi:ribosomal protein L7/L12
MAMKDFQSIQVAPGTEDETVRLWMSFGWELKNKQRVKTQDVQKYTGQSVDHSTSYYETTRGVDFFELSFERDKSRPNYAELVQLEKQYAQYGSEFDFILIDGGLRKLNVIKVLRTAVPGIGLKEAKDLVDKGNISIKEAVKSEAEAEKLKKELEDAGAKVMITGAYICSKPPISKPIEPIKPEPDWVNGIGCIWIFLSVITFPFGIAIFVWRYISYGSSISHFDSDASYKEACKAYEEAYKTYEEESKAREKIDREERAEILQKAQSLV